MVYCSTLLLFTIYIIIYLKTVMRNGKGNHPRNRFTHWKSWTEKHAIWKMAEVNELQIPRVKLGNQGLEVKPNGIPWIPISNFYLLLLFFFFKKLPLCICSSHISLETHLHNLIYFKFFKLQTYNNPSTLYSNSILINY